MYKKRAIVAAGIYNWHCMKFKSDDKNAIPDSYVRIVD